MQFDACATFGGAGFIGNHLVRHLIGRGLPQTVDLIANFAAIHGEPGHLTWRIDRPAEWQ